MAAPDPSHSRWRKSSYSGNGGECVEIAAAGPIIATRDSKDPDGPHLTFTSAEWRAFTGRAKLGVFNSR